jgi:peptidoglycan/LPS O-acetylase OafA/YrhL
MTAAQLVLLHHGFLYFTKYPHYYLGNLGVVIFFLISGFLIGRSVLSNSVRHDYHLSTYVVERFARIYTAFIPALFLVAVIDFFFYQRPSFPGHYSYSLWNAFGNVLMLQGFPVLKSLKDIGIDYWYIDNFSSGFAFWTLPIEWWIYLTFGILFFSIKDNIWSISRIIILVISAISPLYYCFSRFAGGLTQVWIMGFGFSLLYHYGENIDIYQSPGHRRTILPIILILMLLTIPMALARLEYFAPYDLALDSVLALMICAPIFVLGFRPVTLPKPMARVTHYLAGYSYSLYLIHGTLMLAVRTAEPHWINGTASFVAMLLGVNILAGIFAQLFELRYHLVAKRLKALAIFHSGPSPMHPVFREKRSSTG